MKHNYLSYIFMVTSVTNYLSLRIVIKFNVEVKIYSLFIIIIVIKHMKPQKKYISTVHKYLYLQLNEYSFILNVQDEIHLRIICMCDYCIEV